MSNNRSNNTAQPRLTGKSRRSLLWEMLVNKNKRLPATPPVQHKLSRNCFANTGNHLRVTWLGHSSTIIEIDGTIILTDPMFSRRASPLPFLGPRRFNPNPPLTIDDLPPIDAVLVSHDHYDHLDKASIRAIHSRVKYFLVPRGVDRHLRSWGVPATKIVSHQWWEKSVIGPVVFVAAPARHFSGRGLKRNQTLWASWVIIGREQRVYFSGDGGYWDGFSTIGAKYGPFAVTLLECGQYNEHWANIHMMPEQTIQAHLDLEGDVLLPIHWGAFSISLHSWDEPVRRALAAAKPHNIQVATPRLGGQLVYGKTIPTCRWWDES